jgi:hypothetical protein
VEQTLLYRRRNEGSRPRHASVFEEGVKRVEPGPDAALVPNDIHGGEIMDDAVIRHLHMYGRALEVLDGRLASTQRRIAASAWEWDFRAAGEGESVGISIP